VRRGEARGDVRTEGWLPVGKKERARGKGKAVRVAKEGEQV
jgi:hypothetical protein